MQVDKGRLGKLARGTIGTAVGAATDSRQLLDSRVHSSSVVAYSRVRQTRVGRTLEYTQHLGRTYSRARHTRVGRTLEYILPDSRVHSASVVVDSRVRPVLPRVRGDCHTGITGLCGKMLLPVWPLNCRTQKHNEQNLEMRIFVKLNKQLVD